MDASTSITELVHDYRHGDPQAAQRLCACYASMAELAAALAECLRPGSTASVRVSDSAETHGRWSPGTVEPGRTGDPSSAPDAPRRWTRPRPRRGKSPAYPTATSSEASQSIVLAIPDDDPQPPEFQPEAPAPQPVAAGRWQPISPAWRWTSLAGATFALVLVPLLWLGIMILLPTPEGTVKIELSDPQANVDIRVDGNDIRLEGLGKPLRLRTGGHQLVVTGQDFETVTRSFTVKRGKEEPVRITLIPKTPDSARPGTPETGGGEERPAAPQPAVYNVRVEPADGKLLVSGEGASVASDGQAWTVTVARPDGETKIVLLATKSGYENQEWSCNPCRATRGS
jgi:hypothetical protein